MKMLEKFRTSFDLSKTEDRLRLALITIGLLIFIVTISASAIILTMSPGFCKSCHEMTPEYQTWKASSHSEIGCTECHIPPGIANLIIHKITAMREVYYHFSGSYERPIKMGHEIEDSICQECHSKQRQFSVSGDLIIPHWRHQDNQVKCVHCHAGVSHGNIAGREATKSGDLSKWSFQRGVTETGPKFVRPQMVVCMECHQKQIVSNSCKACHKALPVPDDHKAATWIVGARHGISAERNIDYCHSCHAYGVKLNNNINLKDPFSYVRGNSFCSHCHKTKPGNHTTTWLKVHKVQALAKGRENCYACHMIKKPQANDNVAPTYCNKCHWYKP